MQTHPQMQGWGGRGREARAWPGLSAGERKARTRLHSRRWRPRLPRTAPAGGTRAAQAAPETSDSSCYAPLSSGGGSTLLTLQVTASPFYGH